MKYLFVILLIVVLVVPVLGAGCSPAAGDNGGGIELQLPTPSPSPPAGEEWVIDVQTGLPIVVVTPTPQPGLIIVLGTPTPTPLTYELKVMVEPPQPGAQLEVLLNCEAGAEELVILGQYLELRYYITDLNALADQLYKEFVSMLHRAGVWWWPSWDIVPEQGLVVGILQVDCEKVVTLPFVANVGVLPDPGDWVILEELLRQLAVGDVDAVITLSEEITR